MFKRFDHDVRRAFHSISVVHRQGSIPSQDTLSYESTNKNLELNTLKMFKSHKKEREKERQEEKKIRKKDAYLKPSCACVY